MEIGTFAHVEETSKGFDEASASVLRAADKAGWAIFASYDIQERLTAKGFPINRLKIIEICNARHASALIQREALASLCMPCRINIIEQNGKVLIAGMKPSIATQFFPKVNSEDAAAAEKGLIEIIQGAK